MSSPYILLFLFCIVIKCLAEPLQCLGGYSSTDLSQILGQTTQDNNPLPSSTMLEYCVTVLHIDQLNCSRRESSTTKTQNTKLAVVGGRLVMSKRLVSEATMECYELDEVVACFCNINLCNDLESVRKVLNNGVSRSWQETVSSSNIDLLKCLARNTVNYTLEGPLLSRQKRKATTEKSNSSVAPSSQAPTTAKSESSPEPATESPTAAPAPAPAGGTAKLKHIHSLRRQSFPQNHEMFQSISQAPLKSSIVEVIMVWLMAGGFLLTMIIITVISFKTGLSIGEGQDLPPPLMTDQLEVTQAGLTMVSRFGTEAPTQQ